MEFFIGTEHQKRQPHSLSRYAPSQLPELQPWTLINKCLPPKNPDFCFWWRRTGAPFGILLQNAGYSTDAQYQHLLFYYQSIVPELGVGPNAQGSPKQWKSFMTDHFSPIELSWEWGCGVEAPVVRFSIEPIGSYAGTPVDPLNQYATSRLVNRYQPLIPDCDLLLFDHFSTKLVSYTDLAPERDRSPACQGHRSRTFIAFEFGKDALMLKAYFLPAFKAAESNRSTWDIITDAILGLPHYSPSSFSGLSALQEFITSSPEGSALKAEIFAIDCVAPTKSRLKIYMRSRSTAFDSVRTIMTLGGKLACPSLAHGLDELHTLWRLVLTQGQHQQQQRLFSSTSEPLRQKDHRTAGILYYFDIKQGAPLPCVKVYIPVRHYGQNDLAIAEGLATYLQGRGQGALARKYMEALQGISPPALLRTRCGAQTYLGCSIVGERLKLTSYVAPEVYNTPYSQ
ncbi:hypothetical protein MMC20_007141 [Loxospora ochrophaea]|nr:hypothetical protein [Loxospora ochrophaea]